MIKSFVRLYVVVDLVLIVFCIVANNYLWLLNSQIAFISSMIIIIGSFLGYRKNITKRVENMPQNSGNEIEDRDTIDTIEDPFDLYGEINTQEEFSKEEISQIIKDEKQKVKKNSFKNTIFSATGFISPYRLFGYIFLLIGFFALNNHGLLHIYSYFVGLIAVSLATLLVNLRAKSLEGQ